MAVTITKDARGSRWNRRSFTKAQWGARAPFWRRREPLMGSGSRPLGLQGDHGERAGAFQELHSVPIGTQPVQNVGPREAPICPRRKQQRLQTNTLATNESEPWLLSIPPTNPLSADESVDEGGRTGYSQLTASVALSLWWGQHVCECVRVGRGMSRGTLTASRELCRWRPISPVD